MSFVHPLNSNHRTLAEFVRTAGYHTHRLPQETLTRIAVALLSMVALAISSYLGWVGITSGKIAACGGGVFDCDHVLSTKWSNVLGIPVGVAAAALYAGLLVALSVTQISEQPARIQLARRVVLLLSLLAGSAAVWFVSLQVFVIGHLCPWCLAAHGCGLLIAGLVLRSTIARQAFPRRIAAVALTAVAGLAGIQTLSAAPPTFEIQHFEMPAATADSVEIPNQGQASGESASQLFVPPAAATPVFEPPVFEPPVFEPPVFEPPVFEPPVIESPANASPVDGSADDPEQNTDSGFRAGGDVESRSKVFSAESVAPVVVRSAQLSPLAAMIALSMLFQMVFTAVQGQTPGRTDTATKSSTQVREVQIAGGTRLRLTDWPLLGEADARYAFVEMFDYTCPHCRETHVSTIRELKKKYGAELAIVAMPVPLNAKCNPSVQTTHAQHREACELAELAVAVWLTDRRQFETFHNWLFESPRSRTAAEARRQAETLVGSDALRKALASPACSAYIDKHVQLYRKVGGGAVPKLLFPGQAIVGTVGSAATVSRILEQNGRAQ